MSALSIDGKIEPSSDEDWYYIYSSQTGKVTVMLRNIPPNTGYDVCFYKRVGDTLYLKSYSYYASNTEYVDEAGYYYILVTPYSGYNASAFYSLYTQFSSSYDSHEPNDNLFFSKPVTAGDYEYTATFDSQYELVQYNGPMILDTKPGGIRV